MCGVGEHFEAKLVICVGHVCYSRKNYSDLCCCINAPDVEEPWSDIKMIQIVQLAMEEIEGAVNKSVLQSTQLKIIDRRIKIEIVTYVVIKCSVHSRCDVESTIGGTIREGIRFYIKIESEYFNQI
jgi:hypothetical protein